MYRVIHGDCLEGLKQMDDNLFDCILIDPPYIPYQASYRKARKEVWGKTAERLIYQEPELQMMTIRQCIRVLKPGCAFFLFTNWADDLGYQWHFRQHLWNKIIWVKNNTSTGYLEGQLAPRYEVILLGVKDKGWRYRGKRIDDVWYEDRVTAQKRIHPTEKPINLYKKIIELATDEGGLILDPYGGSGSSVIAALELNRNIICYEIDQEYCDRIEGRIQQWKLQKSK